MQHLSFEISDYGEGPEGHFIWGEERDNLFEKFYEASERLDSGDNQKGLNQLRSLIKKDPEFINAYNRIGANFLEKDNHKKGLEYYSKAYKIGQPLIPKGFKGRISWYQTDNRPFLRAMHGLGLSHIRLFQLSEAINVFERILAYNPDDNQGVRFIIGDLYLSIKNNQKADYYFKDNLDFPPYRYSYGLSLFQQRRYIESIFQFWLGFYENIYILEHILDHYPIIKYDISHFTSDAMPEIAKQYYSMNFSLWFLEKKAKQFLQMIYESFSVQAGIQAIFELKSYLRKIKADSAENIKIRGELIKDIEKVKNMVTIDAAKHIYKDMDQEKCSNKK